MNLWTRLAPGILSVLLAGCDSGDSGPKKVSAFRPDRHSGANVYDSRLNYELQDTLFRVGELQSNYTGELATEILAIRKKLNVVLERKLSPAEANLQVSEIQTSISHTTALMNSLQQNRRKSCEEELRKVENNIEKLIAAGLAKQKPESLKSIQNRFERILSGFYEKQYVITMRDAQELTSQTGSLLNELQTQRQ